MTLAQHHLPSRLDPPPPAVVVHTPSRGYDALHAAIQTQNRYQPLYAALDLLPPRQRLVIELRFGLSGGKPLTLDQVANELGVTKQRVQTCQQAAMRRLRPLIDPHLEDMAA